jgi:hypothetical protein
MANTIERMEKQIREMMQSKYMIAKYPDEEERLFACEEFVDRFFAEGLDHNAD